MTDKYEYAINIIQNCLRRNFLEIEWNVFQNDVNVIKNNVNVIKEAIEKASKFDQLVEARKQTTPGKWILDDGEIYYRSNEDDQSYGMLLEVMLYEESNATFVTLAANLTQGETK